MNNHRRSNRMVRIFWLVALATVIIGLTLIDALAQDETELAKRTQNPVADLISVPLQSNFNFGAGSREKMLYILNVQPVIPMSLNDEWNLITRVVTPIINQPSLFPGTNGA